MNLGEILAGGQERRKKLDQTLGETLNYYLGPTGIPQRLAALGVLNPVNDMEQASQKAKTVFSPDATGRERFDAGVGMVTDMATVLAPVAATNRVGGDATAAVVDSLLGIGNTTREGLQDAGRRFAGDEAGNIRVFHGSPHDFDRFSMDKIGTGEGAQAYGHGLYFAESEDVARSYRDDLAQTVKVDGQSILSNNRRIGSTGDQYLDDILVANNGDLEKAIAEETEFAKLMEGRTARRGGGADPWETVKKLEALRGRVDSQNTGRMYEVNINASPDDFLDWDRPLSEQPQRVRDALRNTNYRVRGSSFTSGELAETLDALTPEQREYMLKQSGLNPTGSEIARAAGTDVSALREAGIPGIKYLDAGSRGAGDGSRNYVVFDENLIEIVRKYGVAGAAAMLGMSAADVQAATGGQQTLGTLMANYDQDAEQRKLRDYLQQ